MNSQLNYLVVKALIGERMRAAESSRAAGAGDRDRDGSRRGFLARALPQWRPSVRLERRPCIED
jgi:hypothetical protein